MTNNTTLLIQFFIILIVSSFSVMAQAGEKTTIISSTYDTSLHEMFIITSSIECENNCGNVSAWLDPISKKTSDGLIGISVIILLVLISGLTILIVFDKLESRISNALIITSLLLIMGLAIMDMTGNITGLASGTLVSTDADATPFYTTSNNPQLCGILGGNQSCNSSWSVNTTGTNGVYDFFVIYNSTILQTKSDTIEVKISHREIQPTHINLDKNDLIEIINLFIMFTLIAIFLIKRGQNGNL